MFFAAPNRRRYASGATQLTSIQVARTGCESLEIRQMLTGIDMAPDIAVAVMAENHARHDDVFAEMGRGPGFISLAGTSAREPESSIQTPAHENDDSRSFAIANSVVAANHSAVPLPPVVPTGLGSDITAGELQQVAQTQELYDSITQLHKDKEKCEENIARLEQELKDAKDALDDANAREKSKQDAYDQAVKDAADADAALDSLKIKLDKLKSDLKDAIRQRNGFAGAVGLAGRLAKQARRRGNHDLADSLAATVEANRKEYQKRVDTIRALRKEIKSVRQQINAARRAAQQAKAEAKAAGKALDQAKKDTDAAQQKHDDVAKRLAEAKLKCKNICDNLEAREAEYGAAVAAAEQAIQDAEQRKQVRLAEEEGERQQAEDAAEANRLRQKNQVRKLDLEAPNGTNAEDITPDDVTRLIGQQGDDTVPDNPSGIDLAEAAVVAAANAKATEDAVSSVGNLLLGIAWEQLTNIIPILGTLNSLFEELEGFSEFIQGIQNGDLKYQRDVFTPEWGIVVTETVYNCNTGQYVSVSHVLFYDPSTYTQHAGGAGRDGITVAPGQAGAYTVIHFGTVS